MKLLTSFLQIGEKAVSLFKDEIFVLFICLFIGCEEACIQEVVFGGFVLF